MENLIKIMKTHFSIILLTAVGLIYLSAFTSGINNETTKVKKFADVGAEDWNNYKEWYNVTKKPNTGDPTGFLDGKHGGTDAFREIYINSLGESVNKGEEDFPYPEGTIVVKEAFKNRKRYEQQKKPEITIMIKLAEGASPETNDWEFVMGAKGKKRGSGTSKLGKFCGGCHVNAAATDYTFMTTENTE